MGFLIEGKRGFVIVVACAALIVTSVAVVKVLNEQGKSIGASLPTGDEAECDDCVKVENAVGYVIKDWQSKNEVKEIVEADCTNEVGVWITNNLQPQSTDTEEGAQVTAEPICPEGSSPETAQEAAITDGFTWAESSEPESCVTKEDKNCSINDPVVSYNVTCEAAVRCVPDEPEPSSSSEVSPSPEETPSSKPTPSSYEPSSSPSPSHSPSPSSTPWWEQPEPTYVSTPSGGLPVSSVTANTFEPYSSTPYPDYLNASAGSAVSSESHPWYWWLMPWLWF